SVNPIVLGYIGVPGLEGKGLPFAATLTVTCLTAGLLSILMGLASNYPFALAPGMGLNAGVALETVGGGGAQLAAGDDGRVPRGPRHHAARADAAAPGGDGRRAARPQARDRRGH